jgi:pimeloyl-ACP methyl ester carboxylesterase
MALIEHEGLVIDVADYGAGPPLVLVHSSASSNRQWRKLGAELGGRYRLLAPNLFGYGETTAWSDADGAQSLIAATAPVMAVAGQIDGPFRMVGHSWGGTVALQAAALLKDRVSRLVLFEPMMGALLREYGRLTAWSDTQALYLDVKRYGKAGQWDELARRFTTYFNGEDAWDATPPERQKLVASLLRPNYHEWDAAEETLSADRFADVSADTLLIRSADTRPAIGEMTEVLRLAFPHWQFHELATGGHMAPLTRPDLVNPLITAFLDAA